MTVKEQGFEEAHLLLNLEDQIRIMVSVGISMDFKAFCHASDEIDSILSKLTNLRTSNSRITNDNQAHDIAKN